MAISATIGLCLTDPTLQEIAFLIAQGKLASITRFLRQLHHPSLRHNLRHFSMSQNRDPSKLVGPFYLEGAVTKGFGRGSKELGIPTANFSDEVVDNLPQSLETGIYFGFTHLEHDDQNIRKAVMSIGWNPYYHNTKKSVVSIVEPLAVRKLPKFSFTLFSQKFRECNDLTKELI